jgi:DNA helicase-2/ATP-dependent DNA helicase PcrA
MSNQNYLNALNAVQQNAVTTLDGPVLVIAGPGSGKTRVLTYRIAHILQSGVSADRILSLTFTNKAAREMQERIHAVVGTSANGIWAGTFHSLFSRILRMEAHHIGYPTSFTIYDTEDSKNVLTALIKELNLDKETYQVNQLRNRISAAKSALVTPTMYETNAEFIKQDKAAGRPMIATLYRKYTERCKRAGAMDFDDLLYRLYELLQRNPDNILDKYRQKFKYVMVDEFQDTNHLQYAIIRKLVHFEGSQRNICVVGDDAQSIYSFRGATIQNILDFENDFKPFGIQVFKLEQNYRSSEEIVQAANVLIQHNTKQIQKKIWSNKGLGHKIKVIRAVSDNEEGRQVINTLTELRNRYHLSFSEVAILYRTNAQSRVFEEYCRRENIPYKVFGGLSFYQRKEVKDLIAYLRVIINPSDDEALKRIINYPRRGIGETSIQKMLQLSAEKEIPLWEVVREEGLNNQKAPKLLKQFVEMILSFFEKKDTENAFDLAALAAKQSGIIDLLKADTTPEGISRIENINALLDAVKNFVDEDESDQVDSQLDKSLVSFLQSIALYTDLDDKEAGDETVTLMSVHSAKGLEFKAVFVTGLEENLFPSHMSMDTVEGLDEERRLFYVAITRAETFLTLSYSLSRYKFGQMKYSEMSRFLDELPSEFLESTSPMRSNNRSVQTTSTVTGFSSNTRKPLHKIPDKFNAEDFIASPPDSLSPGMSVMHLKFGVGKIIKIDGGKDNRVATILFSEIDEPERRLMLKFAKLQIINQ